MKKFLSLLLFAGVATMPMLANTTDDHDNRLYFTIDSSTDLSRVPISFQLENPTISITAVEMYLTLPAGVEIVSSQLAARVESTHKITDGDTSHGYFVSVASEEVDAFVGTDGTVCTLICDFSKLQDGDYSISASGMFAVGVDNESVTCYTATDQDETMTKRDGTMTGVDAINVDESEGRLEIYDLQGVRLKEPQKGQINIINGKKVVL